MSSPMSSSPSPASPTPPTPPNIHNRHPLYERALLDAYWDETAKGVAMVLSHIGSTWYASSNNSNSNNNSNTSLPSTSNALFYAPERQRLEKYITPIKYGAAVTLVLFVQFRVTGNPTIMSKLQGVFVWSPKWYKSSRSSHQPAVNPVQKYNTTTTTNTTIQPHIQQSSSQSASNLQKETAKSSSIRFLTDALVSLSVGISTTLFLYTPQLSTIRHDLEQSPLVSGRSVIGDYVCPSFLKQFTQGTMQYQQHGTTIESIKMNQQDSNPKDDTKSSIEQQLSKNTDLQSFEQFVKNCAKRKHMEEQIRKQRNMTKDDDPVVIPY